MIWATSPAVLADTELTKSDLHSFQIADFTLIRRITETRKMENSDSQRHIRTVSASSSIADALVVMAEFERQASVSLVKNPICDRFQRRLYLQTFRTGWIKLYASVTAR